MASNLTTQCGMAAVQLHFEDCGVVIQPFEFNIKKDKGKLDFARGRLSREAGDLLDRKASELEPVSIFSGEKRVARLMYPEEGLEIGMEDCHIELHAELQICKHTEIEKTFTGDWKVADVIDHIFERVKEDDKHGVLTEWKDSTEDQSLDDEVARTFEGTVSGSIPIIGTAAQWLAEKASNRYNFLEDSADFDFDGETAMEILHEIAEMYKLDVFTKDDGILYVGSQEDDVSYYEASMPNGYYNLINYSVPGGNNALKGVVVEGGDVLSFEHDGIWDVVTGQNTIVMHGIALRNDLDDGNITLVEHDSEDPDTLAQVAENHLYNSVATNQGGTAEIDLLSSGIPNNQPDIREIKLDDILIVPEHSGRCQRIRSGAYLIRSINHQINPTDGWIVSLEISRILLDGVESAAFGYDTDKDEIVEDIGSAALYWADASLAGIKGKGFNFTTNDDLDADFAEDAEDEL